MCVRVRTHGCYATRERGNAAGIFVTWIHGTDTFLHRPEEFVKRSSYGEDSEDEESTVGKMPPSESEDEE